MSILIKSITTPESCDDCPVCVILDDLGSSDTFAFCIPLNERIFESALLNKLPNCPIEPFPSNLIDVDKFKEDYHMGDDCSTCNQNTRSCEYDRVYSKMDFCSWLDDAERIGENK